MANIDTSHNSDSKKFKRKVHSLTVDMTPMVDLGFLLITFFVFTAQLSKPNALKLLMPAESKVPMLTKCSQSFTVVADSAGIVKWYGCENGSPADKGGSTNGIAGLRHAVQQKKNSVMQLTGNGNDLFVVIKPLSTCDYKTIVNVLDEMAINDITRYAIAEPDVFDKEQL
jgi:biopolymer transport protein ExbD